MTKIRVSCISCDNKIDARNISGFCRKCVVIKLTCVDCGSKISYQGASKKYTGYCKKCVKKHRKSNYNYCIDCNEKTAKGRPFKTGRCLSCKIKYGIERNKCSDCGGKIDKRSKTKLCQICFYKNEEQIKKISNRTREVNLRRMELGFFKTFSNTLPERKVANILTDMGIEFKKQFRLENRLFDFFLPAYNMLVEVDGCYFHGKEGYRAKHAKYGETKMIDELKNNIAKQKGYKMIRIWEDEINIQWRVINE